MAAAAANGIIWPPNLQRKIDLERQAANTALNGTPCSAGLAQSVERRTLNQGSVYGNILWSWVQAPRSVGSPVIRRASSIFREKLSLPSHLLFAGWLTKGFGQVKKQHASNWVPPLRHEEAVFSKTQAVDVHQ